MTSKGSVCEIDGTVSMSRPDVHLEGWPPRFPQVESAMANPSDCKRAPPRILGDHRA
jgi:hypothetical protein